MKDHRKLRYVRMFCDRFFPVRDKERPTRWERFLLKFATPMLKRVGPTDWRVFKCANGKLWVQEPYPREGATTWPANKEEHNGHE